MSNTACLTSTAFNITGPSFFPGRQISFTLTFGLPSEASSVKRCQWFLNDLLIVNETNTMLTAELSCGLYVAGVRILTDEGWSGVKTLQFQTCKTLLNTLIYGPETVKEGEHTAYFVNHVFSDGSVQDITNSYNFTADYGSFSNNIFTVVPNIVYNDGRTVNIVAADEYDTPLTKVIQVKDATPVILVSLAIYGPDSVNEGETVAYFVKASYSNGTTLDYTNEYTLFSSAGTFLGNSFRADTNAVIEQNPRPAEILAIKNGLVQIKKTININDTSNSVCILVVDIFNIASLDVIGMFDNSAEHTELSPPVFTAYTGNNIVPSAAPSNAVILASDLIGQNNLKWRFEFNIARLVSDYPAEQNLVFYIKGRGNAEGTVQGSYVLKGIGATMTLSGHPGSYLPSVTGGFNIGNAIHFESDIVNGANGSHNPGDLTTIIKLTYNVPTKKISVQTHKTVPLDDFDFMAVSYHWGVEAGNDLDILVGFENNGTVADNLYVGFGHPYTQPVNASPSSDSYLWSGLDNTGSLGYEGVLIGIRKFINDFPNSPDIVEIALYAVWFGQYITGDFDIELVTYKGGSMSIDNNKFTNTGGAQVSIITRQLNTHIRKTSDSPSSYFKIGTIKFNKTTNTGNIEFSI